MTAPVTPREPFDGTAAAFALFVVLMIRIARCS